MRSKMLRLFKTDLSNMEILAQILICLKAASEKWNRSDVSAEGFRLCWFVLMEVKLLLCDKHADPSEPSSGF